MKNISKIKGVIQPILGLVLSCFVISCTYNTVPRKERRGVKDTINTIIKSDQRYRSIMSKHAKDAKDTIYISHVDSLVKLKNPKVRKKHFIVSNAMKNLIMLQVSIDSSNYKSLLEIIQLYGFPGKKEIGLPKYVLGTSMVILHYLDPYQQEVLLPLLKKECLAGKLTPISYARYVDKACLVNKTDPVYGSEFTPPWHCFPSLQETNKNRAEIGLKPIKDISRRCPKDQ